MDIRRSVSTVEVIDLFLLKRENWGEGEVKAGRGSYHNLYKNILRT